MMQSIEVEEFIWKGEHFMRIQLILMTIAAIFLITACTGGKDTIPREENRDQPIDLENTNNNTVPDNNDIADHLATIAAEVPEVEGATAIVLGPYAVVGIDINENTESQKIGTIKYSVSESLAHDPYGREAVIIADADVMQRLRDMRVEMQNGAGLQGILDELAEIVSRYVPTFPVKDDEIKDVPPVTDDLGDDVNDSEQENMMQ